MAKQYQELTAEHISFIEKQKIFFVATAAAEGKVNVSPKGMDSLRVLDKNRVIWLNLTGSGNETAAHVQEMPRMTIMFCAFEGNPVILRLYGQARAIHQQDDEWNELSALLPEIPGTRQIFDLRVELVQTSCGYSVPLYDYREDRQTLKEWSLKKGDKGIKKYWLEKNQNSLDGKPTFIKEKNV